MEELDAHQICPSGASYVLKSWDWSASVVKHLRAVGTGAAVQDSSYITGAGPIHSVDGDKNTSVVVSEKINDHDQGDRDLKSVVTAAEDESSCFRWKLWRVLDKCHNDRERVPRILVDAVTWPVVALFRIVRKMSWTAKHGM